MGQRTFESVPGFFAQSDSDTWMLSPEHRQILGTQAPQRVKRLQLRCTENFLEFPPGFGLLDKSPDRWYKLFAHMANLNREARQAYDTGQSLFLVSYKLILLGRHGQGYHNVGEDKHQEDWESYWGKQTGDEKITWGPDAELTPLGKRQVECVNRHWKIERACGLPPPGQIYCSPLTRALNTWEITFKGILPPNVGPIVLENCRETIGVFTPNKRRTRSYIEGRFPNVEIENGFTEEDTLWGPTELETDAQVVDRARCVLDVIFKNDEPFVSVTAHGLFIGAFLTALGREFDYPETGGVFPVIVKSTCTL